jgi:hypothetical protein
LAEAAIPAQTVKTHMPRIQTDQLLDRIGKGDFLAIKLNGLQSGSFFMMLECEDGTFIQENKNGTIKEYAQLEFALKWLKRVTNVRQVAVNIEIWRDNWAERCRHS